MNAPTLFDGHEDVADVLPDIDHMTPPRTPVLRAVAATRATDPETSRQAAKSISQDRLRETQRVIVDILERFGASCDEDIAIYARQLESLDMAPKQSPSGLRSRRAELVAAGIVRDSGERTKTSSGRQTIVWELSAGSL